MVKALTSAALVLLWLGATVAEGASHSGLVLCFADGHVAVEPAHTDDCAALEQPSGALRGEGQVGAALRSAGCADIPLGEHVGVVSGKRLADRSIKRLHPPQALAELDVVGGRLPTVSLAATCLGQRPELASPHLSHLQTVVLRL